MLLLKLFALLAEGFRALGVELLLLQVLHQLILLLGLAQLHGFARRFLGGGGRSSVGLFLEPSWFLLVITGGWLATGIGSTRLVGVAGNALEVVVFEGGIVFALGDFPLLLLGDVSGFGLAYELHFFVHFFVGGVHLEVGLDLGHGHGLAVTVGDHVVEGEDQVKGFLVHNFVIQA